MTSRSRRRAPIDSLIFLALAGTVACAESGLTADLVLRGGKIVTVDDNLPEAQALAVKDDTISAVGTDTEIDAYVGRLT